MFLDGRCYAANEADPFESSYDAALYCRSLSMDLAVFETGDLQHFVTVLYVVPIISGQVSQRGKGLGLGAWGQSLGWFEPTKVVGTTLPTYLLVHSHQWS